MSVDPYAVIAGARARGLSEATIAKQLGLRDGHTGYGITRQDFERKPVVVVPGPAKAPEPEARKAPVGGRKDRQPDYALAAAIKAAGEVYVASLPKQSDLRRFAAETTMFLIYRMARLTLHEISAMYGFHGNHGPARRARENVQKRMGVVTQLPLEEARQAAIRAMALK